MHSTVSPPKTGESLVEQPLTPRAAPAASGFVEGPTGPSTGTLPSAAQPCTARCCRSNSIAEIPNLRTIHLSVPCCQRYRRQSAFPVSEIPDKAQYVLFLSHAGARAVSAAAASRQESRARGHRVVKVVKRVSSPPSGALTDCFSAIRGGQFSALNNTLQPRRHVAIC